MLTTELDHPFSNWLKGAPGEAAGKLSANHCLYTGRDTVCKRSFPDLRKQKRKTLALGDEFVDYTHTDARAYYTDPN